MRLRCGTFNTLADAYIGNGDYGHVDPRLLTPRARIPAIVRLIDTLDLDVIGIQEAEVPLVNALNQTDQWQSLWSRKGHNKQDGCLTLVRKGIDISCSKTYAYNDNSGHVLQTMRIGKTIFANTHIKWASEDDPAHVGVSQTRELLKILGPDQPAVIFADCNDRPGGPVRHLVEAASFTNYDDEVPTALVDQEPVSLDLLAIRGLESEPIHLDYYPMDIPNTECPSDHIPKLAYIDIS